jgi:MFS family permease
MVATGVVAIDATIVATAVTSIVGDVGGFASFPWLFSIYLLASAVTVPVYSKLADMFGRKPIIIVGIAVFLLGSVLCGIAWNMPSLIVFRGVQGLGAGAVLPITVTMIGDLYSVRERAKVQGYLASVWALASVAGPMLGGLFAQLDAWRGIFLINIPLCALAIWLIARNFAERIEPRRHRIDYSGAALLGIAVTLLMLGVLEGGVAWAWDSPTSLVIFALGALLLVAFVFVERRAAEPVLPFALLRRRVILAPIVMGFGIGATLIGLTAFVPTYLEVGLGVAPLLTGLALATLMIGWTVAASASGRIYLRFGFRATAILGGALALLGASVIAMTASNPSIVVIEIAGFVVGLGLGFSATPSMVAAQSSVEWHERGVVTGTNMFARSIGQSLSAAVLGAVANGVISNLGGNEKDPGAIVAASGAVFVGIAIVTAGILLAAITMPRHEAFETDAVAPEAA